ncbi:MAG: tetratricopeptide repeat protein [Xanthomonadales bacterium]|nr:tetratricopeptide repeat protein [Xanthomonadales bacterium]
MRPIVGTRALVCALLAAALLAACQRDDPETQPSADSTASRLPNPDQPTFSEDVAPIVFEHCSGCHNPTGPAPFSLLTYNDVASRADRIAEVTASRYMPRWLPEAGYAEFLRERRLAESEIRTIQRWVETGLSEGTPSSLPPVPQHEAGWRMGEPDLVASMAADYSVPAHGRDIFRNFVIEIPADSTRWIRAVELRPSKPRLVHHATMWIDRTGTSRLVDRESPEAGYPSMDPRAAAVDPDGQFLGWTPGTQPFPGREGIAWRLDPGTDLVLQLHIMHGTGRPEALRADVGFYFADAPPRRFPFILHLGSNRLDIPAGADDYIVEDEYTLPVAVSVLALRPHAHYLGKRVEVWADLPGGARRWLLKMDWDFSWQEEYQYAKPIALPAGSVLRIRYRYDNSSDNPSNPHDPPQRVTHGPNSTDEMADLWLQVLPEDAGDLAVLEADFMHKERELLIDGYTFALDRAEDPAPVHVDLALVLAAAGRVSEARSHLEQAIGLRPDYATAHNNLGTLLAEQGDLSGAARHFQQTVEIDPEFYEAHYNLGAVYLAQGALQQAGNHLRRGLELNPGNSQAQSNLGTVYFQSGEMSAARDHFSRAVRLEPDNVLARYNLGLAEARLGDLVAAGDRFQEVVALAPGFVAAHVSLGQLALMQQAGAEASRHFQRALSLDPQNSEARQGLARALDLSE